MPLRLTTEPPLSHDADNNGRLFDFWMCIAVVIGLAVIGLVLHYHVK